MIRRGPLIAAGNLFKTTRYFHLALLAHALISRGAEATGAVLLDGAVACAEAAEGVATTAPLPTPASVHALGLEETLERGMCFLATLWTETLLFHARKRHVAHEMQQKYSPPMATRHPTLIPGFMTLLPMFGEALAAHVCGGQSFPQWVPPARLGDWAPKGDSQ